MAWSSSTGENETMNSFEVFNHAASKGDTVMHSFFLSFDQ